MADGAELFTEASVVRVFVDLLGLAVGGCGCVVPIYCFTPNHCHVMLQGETEQSDLWKAMVAFKQRTGYWLSTNRPGLRWQKDFYDHIIRSTEDVVAHARYIAENPVRRGLVAEWRKYPFTGAIGVNLQEVLDGVAWL